MTAKTRDILLALIDRRKDELSRLITTARENGLAMAVDSFKSSLADVITAEQELLGHDARE